MMRQGPYAYDKTMLTRDEERELVLRLRRGEQNALNQLLSAYQKLIFKIAWSFIRRFPALRSHWEDLIQEGNIGLLKALSRFQLEKNVTFGTYAFWWAREYMMRYLCGHLNVVKIPFNTRTREAVNYVGKEKAKRNIIGALSQAEIEEIARYLGVSEEDVKRAETLYTEPVSLNEQITTAEDDAGNPIQDFLVADDDTPEDIAADQERRKKFIIALQNTGESPRNRQIFLDYYGLDERTGLCLRSPATLDCLGERNALSKERIRQIRDRIRRKLQVALELQCV